MEKRKMMKRKQLYVMSIKKFVREYLEKENFKLKINYILG